MKIKYRKYNQSTNNTEPLVIGWVPSKAKEELMLAGKEKELPGYWLYDLQFKYKGMLGRFYGKLFGLIYANKQI